MRKKIKGENHLLKILSEKLQRMRNNFEEDFCEKEPAILEAVVKATLNVLGIRELLGVDETRIESFQATEIKSVKIIPRMCQQT